MEYKLDIEGDTIPAKVETGKDGKLEIRLDEKAYKVDYTLISPHQIHLTLRDAEGGKSFNAFVANGPEGKTIVIDGMPYRIRDADAQDRRSRRAGVPGGAPRVVTPPMPAVVIKILVSEGDEVEKGQGVIVLSAMKMETTLAAPHNGVVAGINVAVDDKVAPGDVLVHIEGEAEEPE